MDERVVQFRVGVTVLAALIITGILVLLFGELPSVVRGSYSIYVEFPSAPGVAQDTPIRKSGILIGRVTKVAFAPNSDVLVTASIDGGVELFRDEAVRINATLLGDTKLEFVPGSRQPTSRVPIKKGDLLAGTVAVDPLQAFANIEGNLSRAADSLAMAGEEVGKLAKGVNDALGNNKDQIARIIQDTDESMQLFQKAMRNVNDIVGDDQSKRELKEAVATLAPLLKDSRETVNAIQKTVALADANLQNIQTVTKAIDERGEQMIINAANSVDKLDQLLGNLNRFTRALNDKQGSLGMLTSDPALYNNLNQTVVSLRRLTQQLEPVINNAKIFSDKIARNPGVIIRDAVSPGPGLK
jgi:phospholipid/cholesterol/gamma-HCH transport system substrate-binding protein